MTGRRAPHDRSTAAVNRTPALRDDAPRPARSEWIQEARSERIQELPKVWFSVITVHGDGRAHFVTRHVGVALFVTQGAWASLPADRKQYVLAAAVARTADRAQGIALANKYDLVGKRAQVDPGLDVSTLPPDLVGPATGLNTALNAILAAAAVQRTISVGSRWDFMKNIDLKLQYDHVDLGAGSAGNADQHSTLISARRQRESVDHRDRFRVVR